MKPRFNLTNSSVNTKQKQIAKNFIAKLSKLAAQHNIIGEWEFRDTWTSDKANLVFVGASHEYAYENLGDRIVHNTDLKRFFNTAFPKKFADILITKMLPSEEHKHGNYIAFEGFTKEYLATKIQLLSLEEQENISTEQPESKSGLKRNFNAL